MKHYVMPYNMRNVTKVTSSRQADWFSIPRTTDACMDVGEI